ncbi:hypothetical protein G7Y89_g2525 [Cudoniella acicularis]|uniref:C2H2-type domain-containing protein n=1 Tax=Cudoniella acicularis TaxID=354080 RepID=A0A8H4RV22_9HELO|nr:hypothetical protein G7Y89_g2525 [Cudoniella acicularis]
MQNFNHDMDWANQMKEEPAFSGPLDPDLGFSGAEAGPDGTWNGTHSPSLNAFHEFDAGVEFPGLGRNAKEYNSIIGAPLFGHGYGDESATTKSLLISRHPPGLSPQAWSLALNNQGVPDFRNSHTQPNTFNVGQQASSFPEFDGLNNSFIEGANLAVSQYSIDAWGNALEPEAPFQATVSQQAILCHQPNCFTTFVRDSDRVRHEAVVHGFNQDYDSLSNPFSKEANFAIPSSIDPVGAELEAQTPAAVPQQPILCHQPNCFITFVRDSDRVRHEAAVHGVNQALHLCPIIGCPKNQGRPYSRADKLKEHMYNKHAALGYRKGR